MESSPTTLILRADASTHIGFGHVMRCLALAQAWQQAGGRATFALAQAAPTFLARLETEQMDAVVLDATPGSAADAQSVIALAQQTEASWIVVDGYHFGSDYQRWIKEAGLHLLVIDDYGHADAYVADIVVNQNISANAALYANRAPDTRLLLGPSFALVRREFWPWRGWQRSIPDVARTVLVTMGGSDPENVTLRVIEALRDVEHEDLDVRVVVGGSNPHTEVLQQAIQHAPHITLLHNVTNMPELMAWADVAIAAGGSTNWELAMLGVPSLLITVADNQRQVATVLHDRGYVCHLGWYADVDKTRIHHELMVLRGDSPRRRDMVHSGQHLVDGYGSRRVITHMQDNPFTLYPVTRDDARIIWEWANDPEARLVSFATEPIPWEHHLQWFEAMLSNPDKIMYLVRDTSTTPIGQVRFDVVGQEATISISVDRCYRGKGYGSSIIWLASHNLFNTTDVQTIHAYVKLDNDKSHRSFLKAGYRHVTDTTINTTPARQYSMHREEAV